MTVPVSHQSPVILQRQHSARHQQHQRQPSSSRNTAPPSREGDHGLSQLPARDGETSRLASNATVPSSHRPPSHSRHSSAMSTGGASSHAPSQAVVDDATRQMQQMQRPRKTSIHGSSGTWNLGKTIGAGSMGKVKLARKSDGSEQVAVKIVPRQMIQDRGIDPATGQAYPPRHDESKEVRTAREAAIVTLLDHPYIGGMRDVIKTNNHWYMLCEYVNGGQMLDYIISHGRLKEKQARKFGRQIASALDYCHRNSIVHRDLKIENILISKTGDIKIIDFGLSNLFSPRSQLKTFCGSLYFAAPELLQAKQYIGPEVDVWSFGIVMYVLVCGKVPFDDQNMPALHAKIKRGVVDYPQWLTNDCRHLLSRMLVTDPRQRASLHEIMTHPWLMKGYSSPPENHLPHREPLALPLDRTVVNGMTGFEFGSSEVIMAQLTKLISSEDYQNAVKQAQRDAPLASAFLERKKPFAFDFDFYKRRSSTSSKDTLTGPSTEVLPYTQTDPVNAYNPLVSVYYLVREKLERDARSVMVGSRLSSVERLSSYMTIPRQPEAAHTSETSYQVKGEPATTGKTRPRARTRGEDEVSEAIQGVDLATSVLTPPPPKMEQQPSPRKELPGMSMFRRLSTRRHHSHHREPAKSDNGERPAPPTLSLQPPDQSPVNMPRKSLSTRRPKDAPRPTAQADTSQPGQPDLLTPPTTADGAVSMKPAKALGRSTSVSEADWRKKYSRPRNSMEPPATSGSDRSVSGADKSFAVRAKSVGHKRESIQSRRSRRDDAESTAGNADDTAGEEDLTLLLESGDPASSSTPSADFVKPVYLKGLFSVQTTSTKPPLEIRTDIIRVLEQLGVSYKEIKGGFVCVHQPSIDLKSVVDADPEAPEATNMVSTSASHRRKLSYGNNHPSSPAKQQGRRHRPDTSYTNSDASNESVNNSVLAGSLILQFEIYIVKVPLLSLHGIQFKSVSKTNTWQYKSLASRILQELRL